MAQNRQNYAFFDDFWGIKNGTSDARNKNETHLCFRDPLPPNSGKNDIGNSKMVFTSNSLIFKMGQHIENGAILKRASFPPTKCSQKICASLTNDARASLHYGKVVTLGVK